MLPGRGPAVLLLGILPCVMTWLSAGADETYRSVDDRECPVLDMPFSTSSGASIGTVLRSDTAAPGWEALSVVELGAWRRLLNWENAWGGDLDLRAHWDTMLWSISGDDTVTYPLTMARFCLQWSQRFEDGYGFEVDASPGVYSSLDTLKSEDLAVPFGFTWIRAVDPDFAFFIGAGFYPTFKQVVDPRLGLRWARLDNVILDLAYPESRLVLSPHRGLRCITGVGARLWPEFNIGHDARERLRYNETRAYCTLEIAMTEALGLSLQGGYVFNREVAFETGGQDVDVEDAAFVKIGLNGLL